MNNELSKLISLGFFKSARKIIIADLLNKQGFECSVKNDELFFNHKDCSIILSDSSSFLIGNDSYLDKSIQKIKKEIYKLTYKGICYKKKLLKNDALNFINSQLNPLIFQCFYDFKIDFLNISKRLNKRNINSVFSKNVFSIWNKNTHFSLKFNENYLLNNIDYSVDFFNLKNDDLFIGYPYSVKFITEPFKNFVYNGNLKEFKEIAYALIDEFSKEFK
ncbi:MAG: hypothetical protein PHN56_06890 [Candidatus Nanoarchaeia archaeon]|nr:hypothetical protein [Candidatus Nanoarchaeia archaeon]